MEKTLQPVRIGFFILLVAALAAAYLFVLYDLSVIEAQEYLASGAGAVGVEEVIHAPRGSILDRNGNLLVSDTPVYNVRISRSALLAQEDPNATVMRLIRFARSAGVKYNDTFPVTASAPFEYTALPTNTQESRLKDYLAYPYFRLSPDITAPELVAWMRDHYSIPFTYTAEEARAVIGIRYELELRVIVNTTDYLFAENVSTDFIAKIKEARLPAVSIESGWKRTYHTRYAAQLLGTMGYITREYYNEHRNEGYTLSSFVGRSGVEAAFEPYLRSTDGVVTTYRTLAGELSDVEILREAKAGANLYLTIDLNLQKAAEDALAETITSMNASRQREAWQKGAEAELAEGGAVVVMDVRTGETLAMASYPSFDLSTYRQDIDALNNDPLRPLWNRCTQGPYEPGSTFKMVTALAGLENGTIEAGTLIYDSGTYTEYQEQGFAPHCWIYPNSHGRLTVVGALENSCNYFFYWLSDHLGINAIVETAKEFGLGSPTGIEIGEVAGVLASREYKRQVLNDGWYAADTLQASIGQSYNLFTPIQIANYVATIANGGTHYKATLLSCLTSGDYNAVLLNGEPTVLNVIDDSRGYFSLLQRGMRKVVTTGTAAASFQNFPIPVAAKTGTVQSDSAKMNTGVFVLYAPATDPEIAIAVVVEKGGSGSALTQIAQDIVLAYYADPSEKATVAVEGVYAK